MTLDDLPPLREVIAEHGLAAKKGLGQHFLLDMNLTRKIARLCEAGPGDRILEIGPGPGGLTRALLETGAQVTAVERDRRVLPILDELAAYTDRLHCVHEDALVYDESGGEDGLIIASNLPYNISAELLVRWLTRTPRTWALMVLMFQREVGERILAEPGSKAYGRLSVLAQAGSAPRLGFHLPARAFTPPPKVESSVLIFRPDGLAKPQELGRLSAVTAAAFGQRRKMLRQSLKPLFGERLGDVLAARGIAETERAENVSVENFLALAADLHAPTQKAL